MSKFPPVDELFESPREWESLLGEAPCGYLLTDPLGRIHFVNNTLLGWLKYNRKEVEKKMRFQDLLPSGERIFYEMRHVVMLKLQNQVNELNYNLIGKDGNRRPMLVNTARRLNKAGKVIALQFVIFLFTDRKKYEQELLKAKKQSEEAAAAKSNFLSVISHEIRTPIHAILNATEILIQDKFSAEQNELLEVIHHSSSNLLDIVNSVLNISKMEAGNVEAIQEPFSIEHLLNQLWTIYQPLAQKKNIDFRLSIPENVPKALIGDKSNLRQVLTNLIGNAIKFTQKGKIELNLKLLNIKEGMCTLQFALKDTGIGISQDEMKNIFEPFTQANQTIHQQFGGTGLGLSISQRILRLLQSEMKVESELGGGSTFTFQLTMPISRELPQQNMSFNISVLPEQFSHLKILIVDDIYSNILVIKHYLEKWKIAYEHVSSGIEAIEKVQTQAYDLIFLDISMPKMDGYETSKIIRSLTGQKASQIPIIALSAFDPSEIKYKIKRSGMNDTLPKPFTAVQLYDTIIKWTSSKKENTTSSPEKKEIQDKKQAFDDLSLASICDLFEKDTAAIMDYLKNVSDELTKTIENFTEAKEQFSLKTYGSAVHENASKIGMFHLVLLREKMAEGKRLLKSGNKEMFVKQCNEIIYFFQQFKAWVQKKMEEEGTLCGEE